MTVYDLGKDREARIAARLAARADRPPVTGPRTVASWRIMRQLIGTHAGLEQAVNLSHKAFGELLFTSGVQVEAWNALIEGWYDDTAVVEAEVDAITDQVIQAGWRITQGPRGGLRLRRVQP